MNKWPQTHADKRWADVLNRLDASKTHVWAFVRSHCNISGNELADRLANEARELRKNQISPESARNWTAFTYSMKGLFEKTDPRLG